VPEDIESAFWEAAKARESIGEAYENLYYTPVLQLNCKMWFCHSQLSYYPVGVKKFTSL